MEIPIPHLFWLKQTFYIENFVRSPCVCCLGKYSSFQIHILPPFRQSCCIALLRKLAPTLCAWIYLVQVDITSIGKLGAIACRNSSEAEEVTIFEDASTPSSTLSKQKPMCCNCRVSIFRWETRKFRLTKFLNMKW